MSSDDDFVPLKMAVKQALGNERFTLHLDADLQSALKVLCDRIVMEIPLVRFTQNQPGAGGILEVVVVEGTYASAKKVLQRILRDIYREAWKTQSKR